MLAGDGIISLAARARRPSLAATQRPGEVVQIDTLFVNVRPDKPIKHFTAYDPVAKWTVGRVATNASAQSAAALLDKLIAEAPFAIQGIQVDGGSAFRANYEVACEGKEPQNPSRASPNH